MAKIRGHNGHETRGGGGAAERGLMRLFTILLLIVRTILIEGEGEESGYEQRVAPQRGTGYQPGEEEGGLENMMGREIIGGGQGVRGRPAVGERPQQLTTNQKRTRPGSTEPARRQTLRSRSTRAKV